MNGAAGEGRLWALALWPECSLFYVIPHPDAGPSGLDLSET